MRHYPNYTAAPHVLGKALVKSNPKNPRNPRQYGVSYAMDEATVRNGLKEYDFSAWVSLRQTNDQAAGFHLELLHARDPAALAAEQLS